MPLSILLRHTDAYYNCSSSSVSYMKKFVLNLTNYKIRGTDEKKRKIDLNLLHSRLGSLESKFESTIMLYKLGSYGNDKDLRNYDIKKIYYLKLKLLNDCCRAWIGGTYPIYVDSALQGKDGSVFKVFQQTLNDFYSRTDYKAPKISVDLDEFEQYLNNIDMEHLIKICVTEDKDEIPRLLWQFKPIVDAKMIQLEKTIDELNKKINKLESENNELDKVRKRYWNIIIRNKEILSHEIEVQTLPNYNKDGEPMSYTTFFKLLKP